MRTTNNLTQRHRPTAQKGLQEPLKKYIAPKGLENSDITSIYLRSNKSKLYVGVTFAPTKAEQVQGRLKKYRIRMGKHVKAAGQYDTKEASRQIELVRIAIRDRVITKDQRNEILASIAKSLVE